MSYPTGAPVAGDTKAITSLKEMRALSHPLRWRLLEILDLESEVTAAQCARLLGESHGLCSFHLRQLAKFGLIEQVETRSRRDRPWRLVRKNIVLPAVAAGKSDAVALAALSQSLLSHDTDQLSAWIGQRAQYPEAWQRAAWLSRTQIWMTPEELSDVRERILSIVADLERRRSSDSKHRSGALPVRLLLAGYPFEYPVSADEDPPPPNRVAPFGRSS